MALDHLDTLQDKTTVQLLWEAKLGQLNSQLSKYVENYFIRIQRVHNYQFVISNIILQFTFSLFLIQMFV